MSALKDEWACPGTGRSGQTVLRDGTLIRFDEGRAGRELSAQLAAMSHSSGDARLVELLLPQVEFRYEPWDLPDFDPYITPNSTR
jgi:hypothetical protein